MEQMLYAKKGSRLLIGRVLQGRGKGVFCPFSWFGHTDFPVWGNEGNGMGIRF